MENCFDYIKGKTVTINDQKVKIDRFIGRGANCVTYECTLIKNGTKKKKMLLKEFMPTYAGFPINEVLTDDSLEQDNNEIIGRYLPALSKEFENAYEKYLEDLKRTDSLINKILETGTSYKRYLIPLPDEYYRKFNIDPNHHTYNAFILFDYESLDIEKTIGQYTFIQRMKIVELLCEIVARFHALHLLFCDLKPSNFIYDFDDVLPILKLFDFDSVVVFDGIQIEEEEVFGTEFFSAPEVIQNNVSRVKYATDVYSLGVILLYFVLYEQIKNKDLTQYKPKDFLDDYYMQVLMKEKECTKGFCNKFVEIIRKCISCFPNKRINMKSNEQPARQLANDIQILIEIYESKGVHPEVMRDKAMERFKDFNLDTNLLTDIK